jgi:hypothetical protein
MGSGLILSEGDLTLPVRVGQNETRPHFPVLPRKARVARTNLRNLPCHAVRRSRKFVRVAQQREGTAILGLPRKARRFSESVRARK